MEAGDRPPRPGFQGEPEAPLIPDLRYPSRTNTQQGDGGEEVVEAISVLFVLRIRGRGHAMRWVRLAEAKLEKGTL